MYGQGHYFCRNCNHLVYGYRGGCGTCNRSLAQLTFFDTAWDRGYVDRDTYSSGGLGFDPFDGELVFNLPGTDIDIEPDGELDLNLGGIDVPMDGGFDDGFGGW